MKLTIPQPLQHEHQDLHERLRQAAQAGGEGGEAAKALRHWSARWCGSGSARATKPA